MEIGSLTIGVDARAATEVEAGRGRVVRELLRALSVREDTHRYVCFARTPWGDALGERFKWDCASVPDPLWHAYAARQAARTCDVFLSSNSYLTVPMLRIPSVAIVYDLIAFHPEMRPQRRASVIERMTLGLAVRSARTLLCISQATADDLVQRFPHARGKTAIAELGVSQAFGVDDAPAPTALPPRGHVLAVGTLEPRKNLPRLVAAYAGLPEPVQVAHPLVVVGAKGWETGETLAALRGLGDRCHVLGSVSDGVLSELYRQCAVFCYPSLGEGFGLPVLEAMAAGAAVLTSNVSALPEVGGDAVEYVDPRSIEGIRAGLEAMLASAQRRDELGARGRARAARFTWDRTAAETLATLEAAAA